MSKPSMYLVTALLSIATLACDEPLPMPVEVPDAQFDFMNGPSDLPNVFRSDATGPSGAGMLFAWADLVTDLVIVVNAPDDPNDLLACGGTERPDLTPVQSVGELQEVSRELRLLRNVNLHLYRPVPAGFARFRDLCGLDPMASGTGDLTSTDNDLSVTGPGANAFNAMAQGVVELVTGGAVPVTAVRQLLIRPDGTCCTVLRSSVRLLAQSGTS